MRSAYYLTVLTCLQGLLVFLHLWQYPIFPEFSSADFLQHMGIAQNVANGVFPPISSQVLYYGVEYYLGLVLRIFGGVPLVTTRWAMGALVLVSVPLLFDTTRVLFQKEKMAIFTTALYVLSGFVWFGFVFNSGLYANFYGLLASLLFIDVYIRLLRAKRVGVLGYFCLGLVLLNAYFSHYTVLFTLFLLPLFGMLEFKSRRSLYLAGIIYIPAVVVLAIFPVIIQDLLAFGSTSGSPLLLNAFSDTEFPTKLAAFFIGFPTLANLIDLITNDYLALLLLASVGYMAVKRRSPATAFVLLLFLLPLSLAPEDQANWRFTAIALLPLTLIGGFVMGDLWPEGWSISPKGKGRRRYIDLKGHPNFRVFGLCLLVITPIFYASVAFQSVGLSLPEQASSQYSDLKAMQWMATQPHLCGLKNVTTSDGKPGIYPNTCGYVSVADWRFSYSPYLGGPDVYLADRSGVTWTDPGQVSYYAAQSNAWYIIVTKVTTSQSSPQVLRTLNSTNSTALITEARQLIQRIQNVPGHLYATNMTQSAGVYSLSVMLDREPWTTYNSYDLGGAKVLYNDSSNVVIYCIVKQCGG